MYIRVNGTGLTREGPTTANLTAKGADTRVNPPSWSAGSATGVSFSPSSGWSTTCTNNTIATSQWINVTATATKKAPFSGNVTTTSQVAVVDVNISSTIVTEANEERAGVFIPVLDPFATSGGVPLSLSVGPSSLNGQVTLTATSTLSHLPLVHTHERLSVSD